MGNPVTARFVRHDFPGLASMTPYQPPGKYRPELDTPEPNRLVADRNSPFGQQVFDIPAFSNTEMSLKR